MHRRKPHKQPSRTIFSDFVTEYEEKNPEMLIRDANQEDISRLEMSPLNLLYARLYKAKLSLTELKHAADDIVLQVFECQPSDIQSTLRQPYTATDANHQAFADKKEYDAFCAMYATMIDMLSKLDAALDKIPTFNRLLARHQFLLDTEITPLKPSLNEKGIAELSIADSNRLLGRLETMIGTLNSLRIDSQRALVQALKCTPQEIDEKLQKKFERSKKAKGAFHNTTTYDGFRTMYQSLPQSIDGIEKTVGMLVRTLPKKQAEADAREMAAKNKKGSPKETPKKASSKSTPTSPAPASKPTTTPDLWLSDTLCEFVTRYYKAEAGIWFNCIESEDSELLKALERDDLSLAAKQKKILSYLHRHQNNHNRRLRNILDILHEAANPEEADPWMSEEGLGSLVETFYQAKYPRFTGLSAPQSSLVTLKYLDTEKTEMDLEDRQIIADFYLMRTESKKSPTRLSKLLTQLRDDTEETLENSQSNSI